MITNFLFVRSGLQNTAPTVVAGVHTFRTLILAVGQVPFPYFNLSHLELLTFKTCNQQLSVPLTVNFQVCAALQVLCTAEPATYTATLKYET